MLSTPTIIFSVYEAVLFHEQLHVILSLSAPTLFFTTLLPHWLAQFVHFGVRMRIFVAFRGELVAAVLQSAVVTTCVHLYVFFWETGGKQLNAMVSIWQYLSGAPGPSGFGSKSTAEDVTAGVDLTSKTIVISGATSGIGKESARVLAMKGAHIIMAIRNLKTGEEVKSEITREVPKARVELMKLDLSSLASVRQFSDEFNKRKLPLNVLINNAGFMSGTFEKSEDGLEKVFATNHIGTFLLTKLLLDRLKTTAKETGVEGRIINVSSEAHKYGYKGGLVLDKLNDSISYDGKCAYGQSKLANVLHARELAKRLKEEGANVTANSLHPGVMDTNFGKGQSVFFSGIALSIIKFLLKTVPQGAATTCYVATSPKVNGISGMYFKDCNLNPHVSEPARDQELARKLWEFSEEFVSKH